MGWFGSSDKTTAPDPASRQDRQRCWDSRDAYFTCLDGAQVVKPGDEGSACVAPKVQYEKDCARSWIEYFNKRRVLAERQQGVLTQAGNQLAQTKKQ